MEKMQILVRKSRIVFIHCWWEWKMFVISVENIAFLPQNIKHKNTSIFTLGQVLKINESRVLSRLFLVRFLVLISICKE